MSKSRDSVEDLRTIDTVTATANAALPKAGGSVTGDTGHADNVKSKYGTGNDLEIYHDGTDSRIDEVGGNRLILRSSDDIRMDKYTGENMGVFNADGSVDLYYDAVKKLATTSTGVDVTGTVTADGLTVDGNSNFNSNATFGDGNELRLGADNDMGLFYSSGTSQIRVNSGTFKLRADDIRFTDQAGTSESMRIDSSGNVGIGTSTTYGKVTIEHAKGINNGLTLAVSDGTANDNITGIQFSTNSVVSRPRAAIYSKSVASQGAAGWGADLIFATRGAPDGSTISESDERMRIDSSGNVLVGNTVTGATTAGVEIKQEGYVSLIRDGNKVMTMTRLTSDGEILRFSKDGAAVGSILSRSGLVSTIVLDPRANGAGLTGASNKIVPTDETGTITDGEVNIGNVSQRFKDAYLSGGVYLGGTGAANKLDDYEEGTWDPSGTNLNDQGGRYTKVGNLVTCIVRFSASGGNVTGALSGLPFTSVAPTDAESGGGGVATWQNSEGVTWSVRIGGSSNNFQMYKGSGNAILTPGSTAFLTLSYIAA